MSRNRRNNGARPYRRNRAQVLAGSPVCAACGRPIDTGITDQYDPAFGTADHKTPVAHGGTDDLDNLQPMHRGCNLAKHSKPHASIIRHSRDWT